MSTERFGVMQRRSNREQPLSRLKMGDDVKARIGKCYGMLAEAEEVEGRVGGVAPEVTRSEWRQPTTSLTGPSAN